MGADLWLTLPELEGMEIKAQFAGVAPPVCAVGKAHVPDRVVWPDVLEQPEPVLQVACDVEPDADVGFPPKTGQKRSCRQVQWRQGPKNLPREERVSSPQTLSEADRRLVAAWAADCAERVLGLFEAESPTDDRPRAAIARTRAYARGELNTAAEILRRFKGGGAARGAISPAAAAAARAAGQAAAVCHMGAHALGAAAYAVRAVSLAAPGQPEAASEEVHWQLARMTADVRAALLALPPVGENRSGPLGPGLLTSGQLGRVIGDLQRGLAQRNWN